MKNKNNQVYRWKVSYATFKKYKSFEIGSLIDILPNVRLVGYGVEEGQEDSFFLELMDIDKSIGDKFPELKSIPLSDRELESRIAILEHCKKNGGLNNRGYGLHRDPDYIPPVPKHIWEAAMPKLDSKDFGKVMIFGNGGQESGRELMKIWEGSYKSHYTLFIPIENNAESIDNWKNKYQGNFLNSESPIARESATNKMGENENNSRRFRLDLCTPAELAIYGAIQEVEKVGADPRLTDVVVMLGKAKDLLSDFVDNKPDVYTEKTLGEKRVRVDFNAQGSGSVSSLKVKTAELIDDLEAIKQTEISKTYEDGPETLKSVSGEKLRLIALAQTAYEEAGMWAVKAATT